MINMTLKLIIFPKIQILVKIFDLRIRITHMSTVKMSNIIDTSNVLFTNNVFCSKKISVSLK